MCVWGGGGLPSLWVKTVPSLDSAQFALRSNSYLNSFVII